MRNLDSLLQIASQNSASDIHIEPGVPIALRIQGNLKNLKEILQSFETEEIARTLLDEDGWTRFSQKGSMDLSITIGIIRCRINILNSSRGIGMVIRLLSSFENSLKDCNLHPDLKQLLQFNTGLTLISGATGSGKSTTLASFLEEINRSQSKHIITIESPIEYQFENKKSFLRQREVGRHTPSFEQGIIDSLREDPDVLVIGEMRTAETMRLTLNAAETGHLVFSTLHSSSPSEALSRIIMSFPSGSQSSIRAQLADCLNAVICQRLIYLPDHGLRIPVCEILIANHAVRTRIRQGELSHLTSAVQTGASDGMWTFERYQRWVEENNNWIQPTMNRPVKSHPFTPSSQNPVSGPLLSPNSESEERPHSPKKPAVSETRIEIPDMNMDLDDLDELAGQFDDDQ